MNLAAKSSQQIARTSPPLCPHGQYFFLIHTMKPNEQDTTLVKVIKILGLYVFPAIIVILITILLAVPAPK
jgi:hypothetical protein